MVSHLRMLSLCALAACSAHSAVVTPAPAAAPAPKIEGPRPTDPRELAGDAHFVDLVHLAQQLDNSGKGHSELSCLVRGTEPIQLAADLSLSVRPLPPAPDRCTEALGDQPGAVTVMSPWKTVTGELPDAILLPFTTTSPAAVKLPTVAMYAARDGVYLRTPSKLLDTPTTPLSPEAAGAWLARLTEPAAVYVTADRAFELRRLVALLKLVPNRHEVALAVALPKGTRLPKPAEDTGEELCAHGLPEPGPNDPEGALDASAARQALGPLREAALSCALSSGGRALLGGKLVLALRVGPDGRAKEACFVSDAIGEPLLRRCLLAHARDITLPAPSPAGFVDMHLPLQLELEGPKPQRASCD